MGVIDKTANNDPLCSSQPSNPLISSALRVHTHQVNTICIKQKANACIPFRLSYCLLPSRPDPCSATSCSCCEGDHHTRSLQPLWSGTGWLKKKKNKLWSRSGDNGFSEQGERGSKRKHQRSLKWGRLILSKNVAWRNFADLKLLSQGLRWPCMQAGYLRIFHPLLTFESKRFGWWLNECLSLNFVFTKKRERWSVNLRSKINAPAPDALCFVSWPQHVINNYTTRGTFSSLPCPLWKWS